MKLRDDLHIYLWNSFVENNCNTYLLGRAGSVMIDPGHVHLFGHVKKGLAADGFDRPGVKLVIATHSHPDHFEGVEVFRSQPETKIALHPVEEEFLASAGGQLARMLGMKMPDCRIDLNLVEGDLKVDDLELNVFHTPGHSPGHICLYWPETKILFSGDLIFNQGVGRTDFPGGSGREIKESIRRMAELDIEIILPGHGEPVEGKKAVAENFKIIEQMYFGYL